MGDDGAVKRDPVTIVGGRPMHRAVSTADLPMGLEQVLTVAGLNHRFRRRLQQDPVKAAASIGVELDETELMLLRSAGPERVAEMARCTVPPRDTRRQFIKGVAASVAALVAGEAYLLCSGCTGADSWERDQGPGADKGKPAAQLVSTLAGYVCYLYVPGKVLNNMGSPHPMMLTLHDETETALAHNKRWAGVADQHGVSIVSVNWTEEPKTPADLDKLAKELSAVVKAFTKSYPVDADRRYIVSRGKATPIVYKAAFQNDSEFWAAAAFLGGTPLDKCEHGASIPGPANLVAKPPALYYLLGKKDADYTKANGCVEMFDFYKKMPFKSEQLDGTTDSAVLKFDEIWQWLEKYRAGGKEK